MLDAFRYLRPDHEAGGALEREAGGEEPLDHGVVEVLGDALPVLQDDQFGQAGVEAGVLDGHRRRPGQRHRQLLVNVAEGLGTLLVGQVQVPEDLLAHDDRHAEERPHRGGVGREPVAVGMLPEIGEPQRLRFEDQQTEDPMAPREIADGPVGLVVEAGGDELDEAGPRLVEEAERAIASVHQVGGGVDDALQHCLQVEVGADRQHRLHQLAQRPRTGVLGGHIGSVRAALGAP